MRTNLIVTISAVLMMMLCPVTLKAQKGIGITALGEYSYNTTYSHQGALDLLSTIPVGSHFELMPALQFSTANIYSAAVQARTFFDLPEGRLFLENHFLFKDIARNGMYDACLSFSLGYSWDYLEVEAGMFGRVMNATGSKWMVVDDLLCEPFNLVYSLKGILRPATSVWNATLTVTNTDIFQMERMWQPIIILGGWYDLSDRMRIDCGLLLKPTGMFHLNAEFYSIAARAGITYYL